MSFLAGGPCLSPACQWASKRLSESADPFLHPCDYFLSTCVLNGRKQRDQDTTTHTGDQREVVTEPHEKTLNHQMDKGLGEETTPDRKSLLLLHLRNILGNETEFLLKV